MAIGRPSSGQNMANPANNNEAKFNAKATCNVLYKIFSKLRAKYVLPSYIRAIKIANFV
ncbi:hypothetical protein [Campylobacter concisus]|uniref:hypothetical protein n=1 Tax=Campylobacter concisus TaxID=199 RepID=UPI0016532CBB|nr:hypothetical protein [Campylobacter concisus]